MIHPSELKKFKKISSDAHSTVLQHPAGHQITIAHKALSEKMRQDLHSIPHFSDGGVAKKDPPPPIDKDKAKQVQDSFKGAMGFYQGTPPGGVPGVHINIGNPYQSLAQNDGPEVDYSKAVQPSQEDISPKDFGIPGRLPSPVGPGEDPYQVQFKDAYRSRREKVPWETEKDSIRAAAATAADKKEEDQFDATAEQRAAQQKEKDAADADDLLQERLSKIGLGGSPAPDPGTPTGPAPGLDKGKIDVGTGGAPSDIYGYGAQYDAFTKGLNLEKAGIRDEAAAQGALGKQEAGIYDDSNKALAKLNSDYQTNVKPVFDQAEAIRKDLEGRNINPNQFWGNMTTGEKVQTTIGLILGGIGGALSHQENPALKFLNSQIDRDIEGQKADIGKKQNLLAHNLQLLGNMRDAMQMSRINLTDASMYQLKEAAAKAQDPLSKAAANKALGELMTKNANETRDLTARRQITGQMKQQGADPATLIKILAPPGEQAKLFKDLQDAQNTVKMRDNILSAFDQLEKKNTVGNRIAHGGFEPAQVAAIRDPILAQLSKDTAGRFTEADAKYLESIFPAAGDTGDTPAIKRRQLNKLLESKMSFPSLDYYQGNPAGPGFKGSRYDQAGERKLKLGPPVGK